MAHIAVERNRRRQMNDNLKVLRSLTPCFYIKRGDQASIIGGVIDFIKELHQVVDSLEANKRRKVSVSPSQTATIIAGPTTPRLLPPPPLMSEPSPKSFDHQKSSSVLMLPQDEGSSSTMFKDEVVACCNSAVADVEAKISGSNVVLRTVSKRNPTQISKIITVLERFSLEILHLNVSSMEDTVLYSFIIKIGLECELSLEELASQVQQSFSSDSGFSKGDNYFYDLEA